MTRTCSRCGSAFEAERSTARFCGKRCRQADSRQRQRDRAKAEAASALAEVVSLPTTARSRRGETPQEPSEPEVLSVESRARRELGKLSESALGQMCLQAARRLDEGRDTSAAGVASLMKRLEDMLATAAGILAAGTAEEADEDDPIAYFEQRGHERARAWHERMADGAG